jgi:hypothetical protein
MAADAPSQLESNVLAVADDLDDAQRVQFVILAWQSMPHEQLHSIIRRVAKESVTPAAGYRDPEPMEL